MVEYSKISRINYVKFRRGFFDVYIYISVSYTLPKNVDPEHVQRNENIAKFPTRNSRNESSNIVANIVRDVCLI